jgi:large-conductance mechanosensitive channel
MIVKGANAVRRRYEREGPDEPAAPTPTEALLTEIRDLLKSRQA